jgi:hypothetical protein
MGESEYGTCDMCNKEAHLSRKYYHYNIDCDCCGNEHFEFVSHCKDCIPIEPRVTRVHILTEQIKDGSFIRTPLAVKSLTKALREDEGYRTSWVANIAMAYVDAKSQYRKDTGKITFLNKDDTHIIANKAAEKFINQLIKE